MVCVDIYLQAISACGSEVCFGRVVLASYVLFGNSECPFGLAMHDTSVRSQRIRACQKRGRKELQLPLFVFVLLYVSFTEEEALLPCSFGAKQSISQCWSNLLNILKLLDLDLSHPAPGEVKTREPRHA